MVPRSSRIGRDCPASGDLFAGSGLVWTLLLLLCFCTQRVCADIPSEDDLLMQLNGHVERVQGAQTTSVVDSDKLRIQLQQAFIRQPSSAEFSKRLAGAVRRSLVQRRDRLTQFADDNAMQRALAEARGIVQFTAGTQHFSGPAQPLRVEVVSGLAVSSAIRDDWRQRPEKLASIWRGYLPALGIVADEKLEPFRDWIDEQSALNSELVFNLKGLPAERKVELLAMLFEEWDSPTGRRVKLGVGPKTRAMFEASMDVDEFSRQAWGRFADGLGLRVPPANILRADLSRQLRDGQWNAAKGIAQTLRQREPGADVELLKELFEQYIDRKSSPDASIQATLLGLEDLYKQLRRQMLIDTKAGAAPPSDPFVKHARQRLDSALAGPLNEVEALTVTAFKEAKSIGLEDLMLEALLTSPSARVEPEGVIEATTERWSRFLLASRGVAREVSGSELGLRHRRIEILKSAAEAKQWRLLREHLGPLVQAVAGPGDDLSELRQACNRSLAAVLGDQHAAELDPNAYLIYDAYGSALKVDPIQFRRGPAIWDAEFNLAMTNGRFQRAAVVADEAFSGEPPHRVLRKRLWADLGAQVSSAQPIAADRRAAMIDTLRFIAWSSPEGQAEVAKWAAARFDGLVDADADRLQYELGIADAVGVLPREALAKHLLPDGTHRAGLPMAKRTDRLKLLANTWGGWDALEAGVQSVVAESVSKLDAEPIRSLASDARVRAMLKSNVQERLSAQAQTGSIPLLQLLEYSGPVKAAGVALWDDVESLKTLQTAARRELALPIGDLDSRDRLLTAVGMLQLSEDELAPFRLDLAERTTDTDPQLRGRVRAVLAITNPERIKSPVIVRRALRLAVEEKQWDSAFALAAQATQLSALTQADEPLMAELGAERARRAEAKRQQDIADANYAQLLKNFRQAGRWRATMSVEGSPTRTGFEVHVSDNDDASAVFIAEATRQENRATLTRFNRETRTMTILFEEPFMPHPVLKPARRWVGKVRELSEDGVRFVWLIEPPADSKLPLVAVEFARVAP